MDLETCKNGKVLRTLVTYRMVLHLFSFFVFVFCFSVVQNERNLFFVFIGKNIFTISSILFLELLTAIFRIAIVILFTNEMFLRCLLICSMMHSQNERYSKRLDY